MRLSAGRGGAEGSIAPPPLYLGYRQVSNTSHNHTRIGAPIWVGGSRSIWADTDRFRWGDPDRSRRIKTHLDGSRHIWVGRSRSHELESHKHYPVAHSNSNRSSRHFRTNARSSSDTVVYRSGEHVWFGISPFKYLVGRRRRTRFPRDKRWRRRVSSCLKCCNAAE